MTAVPPMVNFSGMLQEVNGKPITGIAGVTFYLYKDSQGGAPLWMETQNVQPDRTGHYTVMLGSTTSRGLPAELFASGQARWLAIQPQGQPEQARILLLSVPYALKAGDAATLGGLPASAFLLAAGAAQVVSAAPGSGSAAVTANAQPPATCNVTSDNTATANQVAKFMGGCVVEPSAINEISGQVGIGTTSPSATLEVKGSTKLRGKLTMPSVSTATASSGSNSQPLILSASAFNSGTAKAANQYFEFLSEPINNNTTSAAGTLNLLTAVGTGSFSETGLKIANNGRITFASGQTFPGSGSVTSVASGAGLTGGPITTSGTLSIASGGVTNAMLANSSLTVTAGTDLTGGGAVALGGTVKVNLDTGKVPLLTASNTFNGYQTFTTGYGWFQAGLYSEPFLDVYGAGNGTAIYGYNDSTAGGIATMYLENDDSTFAGDLVFNAVGPSFGGQCTIDVSGNLFCTGPLGTAASTPGNRKVGLYAVQSSENWVEDFGSAKLSGGVATVQLEPHFGQAVTAANYHVFLTPAGDCQGLYITNRTATSFEVHELKGGKSSVEFDYRIVAHRKGFESARLPDVTSRFRGKVARPQPPNLHQAGVVARK
ncbi:MAG: hypothetical protein WB952_07240 [Terriglobales bacterium]